MIYFNSFTYSKFILVTFLNGLKRVTHTQVLRKTDDTIFHIYRYCL